MEFNSAFKGLIFININYLYPDLCRTTKMHINSGNLYMNKPEIKILLCIQRAVKESIPNVFPRELVIKLQITW
jgi:hypothetical protein